MIVSIRHLRACGAALAAVGLAAATAWSQGAGQPKVVFLRGTAVVTADVSGENVRELVADDVRKADPQWSPRGDHIVYRTSSPDGSDHPFKHAHLVVIRPDGGGVGTVPVLATEPDGTTVGGMRFVEASGWHGDGFMFAWGSVGPRSSEYRVIDLSGRVAASYFGTDFATCAARGTVAYVVDAHDPSKRRVEVDGSPVYSAGRRDSDITALQWTPSCSRLAVHETSPSGARIIVLRSRRVEARLALPANAPPARIVPAGDSFVVAGLAQPLQYDANRRSLRAAAALRDAEPRLARLAAVVEQLGGRSAHWWSPSAPAPGR